MLTPEQEPSECELCNEPLPHRHERPGVGSPIVKPSALEHELAIYKQMALGIVREILWLEGRPFIANQAEVDAEFARRYAQAATLLAKETPEVAP